MDLNEEGGSTKDVISQFIMTKYDVFQKISLKVIEQMNYEHFKEKSSKTMVIFLEEQIRVSKEERIEMTAENISQVVQGQSKLIEEGKYRQPAEGVDEGKTWQGGSYD
ncbi:hypothetical protein OIU84_015286 [Salix udensis]|uniref:Uncharacterized protein n=1 Tax=Salix udensis TaxID=889485 RepID=A0AAD6JFS1_9ROSI|nr:hypothetical protein OIU84_015286 [Salix udensis]